MLDFTQLSPLMRDLHAECVKIYYLMLPLCFALAIALQWFRSGSGSFDFIEIMKRTLISTLLLIAFPEITQAIISVSDGIAARIDEVSNLEKFLSIAEQKIDAYTLSPSSLLLGFNDLFLSALTFLSFLFVYIARYLTLAMYHFFWLFFVVTAPLLLLFNLFSGTRQITVNLFKGMIEVASWKIVWAILGVMLTSLSFSQIYMVEGSYVTVMVMNFVIAVAMIATPLIVHSLVGNGLQSVSPMIGATVVAALATMPSRGARVASMSRNLLKDSPLNRQTPSGRRRTHEKKRT